MVWSTTRDGLIDYFNDQYYQFTGHVRGSGYGETWSSVLHPDDVESMRKVWQRSLARGSPHETEFRMRHHSGEYRWVLARAAPVRDQAGEIISWIGTTTDIQDQKRTQEVLAETVRLREEFFSIASHELKSPLTTLLLKSEVQLKSLEKSAPDTPLKDSIRRSMGLTNRQSQHLLQLVNSMLDLTRVRS